VGNKEGGADGATLADPGGCGCAVVRFIPERARASSLGIHCLAFI
jgi:hypothetical protein